MPTSVRMNKMNRGKVQESLGKSVETGLDVSNRKGMTDLASRKKFKPGGSVKSGKPRGCGMASKGVRNAKMITMKGS